MVMIGNGKYLEVVGRGDVAMVTSSNTETISDVLQVLKVAGKMLKKINLCCLSMDLAL